VLLSTSRKHARSRDDRFVETCIAHASRVIARFHDASRALCVRVRIRATMFEASRVSLSREPREIFFRKHVDTLLTRD